MPLDFSGYINGIVNNGPGYRQPTVIEICQALEVQIKLIKQQIGSMSEADYNDFKQTVNDALGTLQDAVSALQLALPNKEDKANKTTVIDSDSTDTQYPSAKAVYDALDAIAGALSDINTALDSKADGYTVGHAAKLTAAIPYGECDNTSTATAFTVTVPGITELKNGVCALIKNGVITSAAGCTIDVNGLGAKPLYSSMAAATAVTTVFNINYTMLFIYDEDRVSGGCWVVYYGYYTSSNSIGYQVRTNSQRLKMTDKMYRYRLMFTGVAPDTLVPANKSSSTNATAARTPITTPINPHGPIYYYGYTTAIDAGSRPASAYYWQQYVVTLGYSFTASTLTEFKSLYLKCTPQADGSAVIDASTPYVQDLPTTADGKIYIFLGVATSTTAFELNISHPIYYHDGTALRVWTGPVS